MRKRNDESDDADSDDELPKLDGTKLELESVSDSSDWHREGNGIPCRFYNRDGCLRGASCRFSHAPDHKSVRDRLYARIFSGSSLCAGLTDLTWDTFQGAQRLHVLPNGDLQIRP